METIHDVLRQLIHVFGAGEKYDQALAVINHDDPAVENPDPGAPPELTPEQKAAEYDRLQAAARSPVPPAASPGPVPAAAAGTEHVVDPAQYAQFLAWQAAAQPAGAPAAGDTGER